MTKIYALFNKNTRKFSSWMVSLDGLPSNVVSNLLLREIILEDYGITNGEFNPEIYKWIGDYDTGKFVNTVEQNISFVTEEEINQKYDEIFDRKFNLREVLYEIVLNLDMTTEKGKAIQTFLQTLIKRKNNDVERYKNSPYHVWVTKEDQIRQQNEAFKI